jgi:hypothetical protein
MSRATPGAGTVRASGLDRGCWRRRLMETLCVTNRHNSGWLPLGFLGERNTRGSDATGRRFTWCARTAGSWHAIQTGACQRFKLLAHCPDE